MDFDDDLVGINPTSHPLGWLRSFTIAIQNYKARTILIFCVGIIATAFDVLSFGVVLAGLELLKDQGEIAVLSWPIAGPLTQSMIIKGVVIFAILRLITALAYYYSMILTAKTRRLTFQNFITEAVNRIRKVPHHPYVSDVNARNLSRTLRRECRYASRATTDALLLPRPIAILIVITIIGLTFQPVMFLSLFAILLISLPFHALVARWGANVMQELLDSGAVKSQKDKDIISDLLKSPFAEKVSLESAGEVHAKSLVVARFLDAYENRSKLTPVSQFVSSLTFLFIFIFIGAMILIQFTNGNIDIVAITAIIIGIRFASSAIIDVASNITVIASYSPLISDFLDFLRNDAVDIEPPELSLKGAPFLSNRACLISLREMDISRSNLVSKLWRKPLRDNHFIQGRFSEWSEFSREDVMRAFEWSWKDMTPNLRAQIEAALDDISKATEPAAALIAAWLNTQDSRSKNIFWDSRSFSQITGADRIVIMNWLKKIRLLVYYSAVPRNVPMVENMVIWVERDNVFYKIGDPSTFKACREKLIEFLNYETDIPYEDIRNVSML